MTTVNELREKRATAWNAAKAFLESRRTDKGTLTAVVPTRELLPQRTMLPTPEWSRTSLI